MSNLKLSIDPGFFLEPQTATWEVGPNVEYVVFNRGGVPPAISEYIAYDTLSPPRPFVAVTQDGRGNVVYDGGFPKFYNMYAPAAGSTFAQLSPAFKYLYNAIKWIANPEKVANGNKKILVLGDGTDMYVISGTGNNDFKTSFDRVFAAAGFVPTYKLRTAYASTKIDARLAELNQYCAVILMSSLFTTVPQITDESVSDLTTFRSQGNGIMMITDHGQVINNIVQAESLVFGSVSSFATANKLAVRFGAYFSGDFNRSPVEVGYLRNNYGDHPLYNGMANSESIFAGGSESQVYVASYEKYTPSQLPALVIGDVGQNLVQAVAKNTDGTIETYRGIFVIGEGNLLEAKNEFGQVIDSIDVKMTDRLPTVGLAVDLSGQGTVLGEIRLNSVRIGSFVYTDEFGTSLVWFTGSPNMVKVNNGDSLDFVITAPLTYKLSIPIARFQPNLAVNRSLADMSSKMEYDGIRALEATMRRATTVVRQNVEPNLRYHQSSGGGAKELSTFFGNVFDGSKMPSLKMAIYANDTAALAGLASYVPPSMSTIFQTWGRAAGWDYYPPGSNFPEEAAAWIWNDSTKSVEQPLNTVKYVSFVSPEKKDAYVLDVVVSSTSSDDDVIGVLLAMPVVNPAVAGNYNGLYAYVVRTPALANGASLAISTDSTTTNMLFNYHIPTQAIDNGSDGWLGKSRRIKVTRKGDSFKVETSDWNSEELLPGATIEFKLTDLPQLEQFRGPQHFGLMSFSQPQSTYSKLNIVDGSVNNAALVINGSGVYQYVLGGWEKTSINYAEVFGVGRLIENSLNSQKYRVSSSGQLTLI